MSQNPFDALGGAGGFDMNALLEQAQQMQSQLEDAQARLASTQVSGSAGGDAVTVTVNGVGELQSVNIQAGSFDLADADSAEELGDFIVVAYRDAKAKADDVAAEAMGPLAGGGGLPGLG